MATQIGSGHAVRAPSTDFPRGPDRAPCGRRFG